MRLIDRSDTSLAVALVASSLVMFQKPLRVIIDSARVVEDRYNLDLLPGLTVLVGAFAFHQYRKRQQARAGGIGPAEHGDDVGKLCARAFSAPLPPTRSAPARASP